MQSPRGYHGRRACAGAACAVWLCALAAGCQSFYGPPRAGPSPLGAPPPIVMTGPGVPGAADAPPGTAVISGPPAPVVAPGPSAPVYVAPPAAPPVIVAPGVAPPSAATPAIDGVPPVVAGPTSGGVIPVGPPHLLPPQYGWALTLTPAKIVMRPGSEVILLAAVHGAGGHPVSNERIEWMLSPDSVGQLLAVGQQRHYFSIWPAHDNARGKISNQYAIGNTSIQAVTLPRGTLPRADDVRVAPGEAWVSVTSPTEGTTHVTAFAPGIPGLDRRQQSATIYWVDSEYSLPAPAIGAAGSRQSLTTVVTRQSDGSPVENGLVRYEIAGGPPAGFAPSGATVLEVPTDAHGRASVEIIETQPSSGTNQIDVQGIRLAPPGTTSRRLVVVHGGTTVTWTAAQLGLKLSGPAEADVGSTVTYHIELANSGDLPATGVVLSGSVPPGMRFVKSSLASDVSPSGLQWRLDHVDPQQNRAVDVDFLIEQPGSFQFCVDAAAAGGLRGHDCLGINASAAALEVHVAGPQTAAIGDQVTFHIAVTNHGTAPAENLVINDSFDPGLQHSAAVNSIDRSLGRLAPGQTRDDLAVTFRVAQAGRLCQRVEVRGPGIRPARAEACLTAGAAVAAPAAPGLEIHQEGPRTAVVGESILFKMLVANTGNTTLRNVKIVDTFDAGLKATKVSPGYVLEEGQIAWRYDSLAPGERKQLQAQAQAQPGIPHACTRATITADGNLIRADEACVDISQPARGAPAGPAPAAGPPRGGAPAGASLPPMATPTADPGAAGSAAAPPPSAAGEMGGLSIDVASLQYTVVVGRKVEYEVRVTNNRDTADRQVVVMVAVPTAMSLPAASAITAPAAATINGQMIRFAAVAEIHPGEPLSYRIPLIANRTGKVRLQVQVTSQTEQRPIVASAETVINDERQNP